MQQNNAHFLIPGDKKITQEMIMNAIKRLNELPCIVIKDNSQLLTQTLFALSMNWDDRITDKGLELAKLLIDKGADLSYRHTFTEEHVLGNSVGARIGQAHYTQSTLFNAHGRLAQFFKEAGYYTYLQDSD